MPVREWVIPYVLLLLSMNAGAQDLASQTNIFIPDGMEISMGSVTNTGFILNQGTLRVDGNWQNTGVYQGLGTLWLTGQGEQTVFNNRHAVNNLVIDGGGAKVVRGLLPVSGGLEFLHGIVHVQDGDTLYALPSATISGGSPLSFVNGPFTAEGTGYRFFPIGSGGSYYPVELLNVTGIQPVNAIRVIEEVPALRLPPASALHSDVYWERKTLRGTFTGSPLSIGYTFDDSFTNRYEVEIFQGHTPDDTFASLGETSFTQSEGVGKVASDNSLTGAYFVIGGTIPPTGVTGEFYMSTSLSPHAANADNQYVRIFGNQLSEAEFHLMVYNRWGLLIYENRSLTSMITRGWDGRQKGTGDYLPAGAYPYLLKAKKSNGENVEIKGVISIVN